MDVLESECTTCALDKNAGRLVGSDLGGHVDTMGQPHTGLFRCKRLSTGGRTSCRVAAAVVLLAGPLLVFFWFRAFSVESVALSDDGAYAVHAAQLQDGAWSVPHVLADSDPSGEFYAYEGFIATERGFFLAPRHAIWTSMEAAMQDVFGEAGLRVLPALGLAVCAFGAGRLATELGHATLASGAAALVVASPILYHSLQMWAHAVVAAAMTLAVLGAARLISRGLAVGPSLLMVGGGAAASALRGDGFIFTVALAIALAAAVVTRMRRSETPHSGLVVIAAVLALSAILAHRASAFVARPITGSPLGDVSSAPSGDSSLVERLGALTATLYSSPRGELLAFALC